MTSVISKAKLRRYYNLKIRKNASKSSPKRQVLIYTTSFYSAFPVLPDNISRAEFQQFDYFLKELFN